jgi:DNA-binding NtrC family response regulator
MTINEAILIVDDEPQIQAVLEQILKLRGLCSVAASTGKGALEALSARRFSLVLIDLNLPDMSGVELAEKIGLLSQGKLPVIIISGDPDLENLRLPPCVVATLEKPFNFASLLLLVERCLSPAIQAR